MLLRKTTFGGAGLVAALAFAMSSATASTPPTSMIAVPSSAGQTVSVTWTGLIPPGAQPASSCTTTPDPARDHHRPTIVVPANLYDTIRAEFKFTITWVDPSGENVFDEILSVYNPAGEEIGSSDGGSTTETVVVHNLPAGTYDAIACAFASPAPVDYTGKLEIKTTDPLQPLPSADPQGLAFSAAVAADNQRDESEPLIEIDRAGNMYTCGPTGFSNASDYAQVSTDGGKQFHMLGTPPRGQQGAGGGGDCGLATGVVRNGFGNYQYAYSGLGPLTGFVSSTSHDNGHTLVTGGPQSSGITSQGGGADRQWNTFVDPTPDTPGAPQTVLIIYNQQQPRNVVVQTSTDGGLTYSPVAPIGARSPRFPGPIKFNENYDVDGNPANGKSGLVYFPWDDSANAGVPNAVNLSISTDKGATWFTCQLATTIGSTSLFPVADHDNSGNLYVVYTDGGDRHTYLVTVKVEDIFKCNQPAGTSPNPTNRPNSSAPLQVDRDAVRSTVFPWLAADGAPGRVAVTFHGTPTEGNPDLGSFDATWHVYVNQSLNALDPVNRTFSQVKATTHPFHYDSICLRGLSCDISVPPGDRSLADFYAIDYNRTDGRLSVVYNRANKRPDEATGHVASPMVATQIGGPSNGGGAINAGANDPPLRSLSADPPGDALINYSSLFVPPPAPPALPATNEPAGDFLSAEIGPELAFPAGTPVPDGGFTVKLRVANLSNTALQAALTNTQSASLMWVWRFTNGFQDAAAAARWNAAQGFTFGFNNYTTGAAPCEGPGPPESEKCVQYPGNVAIQGRVVQATGTIEISVPRSLLKALSLTGPGCGEGHNQRPCEVPATAGSRLYDGTAFSLGNSNATPATHSWLYPMDNTPSMDFLLAGPTAVTLRMLDAARSGGAVILRWRTTSELGNLGFNVYRAGKAGKRVKLNGQLIRSAASGTTRGHLYTWRDRSPGGSPRYWIQEVQLSGKRVLHGPVAAR